MSEYASKAYTLTSPTEYSAARMFLSNFRAASSSERFLEHPEGHTAASQQGSTVRTIRPYTDEELEMLKEADRFPADLREQVRAFLEG